MRISAEVLEELFLDTLGELALDRRVLEETVAEATVLPEKQAQFGLYAPLGRSMLCKTNGLAAGLGFEPRSTDPESAVLPLNDPAAENRTTR